MASCEELDTPPDSFESAIFIDPETQRRTILVTPRGDERLYQGRVHHTLAFEHAVDWLDEGTTLRLLPGKYYRAADVGGKRGTAEKPIIIEGALGVDGRHLAQICGSNAAGSIYPDLPDKDDYAFIKLRSCRYVIVRNLSVESCWPCFIYAEGSSHLAIEDIAGQDGTYLVFIRGPWASDIAVRRCRWTQDPTGTLWSGIDWQHLHHGPYAYYNGALVGGIDVQGNLDVAGNVVDHAFNGVRLDTSSRAPGEIQGRFNVNVRIRGNSFSNIRDNVFEPEKTLMNWHVFDNRVRNTHAAFSIHDFVGGYLYVYGNEIWFDDRGGADYQGHRGGKVYKLRQSEVLPEHPLHIFHNSIYARTFLIKEARARNFVHRNNAVQFCLPDDHALCLCGKKREFVRDFPTDEKGRPLPWDDSVVFDGDATNGGFSEVLLKAGQERSGIDAGRLGFSDPRRGNFALTADSPLRSVGTVFQLEPGRDLPKGQPAWRSWERPGKPHIGAVQEDGRRISLPFHPLPLR